MCEVHSDNLPHFQLLIILEINMNRLPTLFLRLMLDKRVPLKLKILPVIAVVYLLLPWDFIPDLMPLIGWIDDIVVVILSIGIFFVFGPLSILTRNIGQNHDLDNEQPVNGKVVEGKYRVVDDDGDTTETSQ